MKDTIEPVALDSANFESEVLQSDVPVLVDFWAAWCGPCRAIAPVIQDLAVEVGAEAKVAKLDVDANPELAARFGVASIPSLLFFHKGEEVDRRIGGAPVATLAARLRELA